MTVPVSALLLAAWDAVVTLDGKHCITGWNAAAEALLGWTERHMLGKSVFEVLLIKQYCTPVSESGPSEAEPESIYSKRWKCWAVCRDGRQVLIELIVLRSPSPAGDQVVGMMRSAPDPHRPANDLAMTNNPAALVRVGRLTQRQCEILLLMISGLSNRAIAERLSVAQRTVESHRREVIVRLGVRTSAEAMETAFRAGMRPSA